MSVELGRWERFDRRLEAAMLILHEAYAREQPQSRFLAWRAFDLAGAVFAGRQGAPLEPWGGAHAADAPEFGLEACGGWRFFERRWPEGFVSWGSFRADWDQEEDWRGFPGDCLASARRSFHHRAAPLYEALRQAELEGLLEELPDDFFRRDASRLIEELGALTDRARLESAACGGLPTRAPSL